MMQIGLVTKAVGGNFYLTSQGEKFVCRASLKLKKIKILPGDNVEFSKKDSYIKKVLPRTNELIRPKIANVENALLVFSIKEPKMNFNLLDKMLLVMEYNNLESKILVTKIDLVTKEDLEKTKIEMQYYEKIGYEVIYTDKSIDKKELIKIFDKNKKYVITGQSGVGKSTFLNNLLGFDIKTQEISKALGRGKHTTRETTFYEIDLGVFLIDTPGFSSLDLKLKPEDIRDNFKDFFELAHDCKYNTCYHNKEPKCNVKKNVENSVVLKSRYTNYLKFLEEK